MSPKKMGKMMKFRFAFALLVASTVVTQGDYAYALDCNATNLTKREKGICDVQAATAAGATVAPSTTSTTANRCAGQAGQALVDCKSFNLASCIPLVGAKKTECMALYGG